ncbi:hypothetical protein [Streptomyces sp. Y7]|uniref:hypothetical protein n=1 Tax=Streptomyces sp. Y7 TaxID=3342392 RepID=UPI003713AD94
MRTTPTRVRRLVTALAGAALVTGCGSPALPTSTESSPAPFGRPGVQAELKAAAAAAGAPEKLDELDRAKALPTGATEKDRKLAALTARLSPCTVSWTNNRANGALSGPNESRQQLDGLLSHLAAHGWRKTGAATEAPVGDGGTYFTVTYKKRGWTLNARHMTVSPVSQSTVVATEDTCFNRLTDEEAALLEG